MLRLIMFVAFVAIIVVIAMTIMRVIHVAFSHPDGQPAHMKGSETHMPSSFRQITFVLLFILLIGVSMGWLGAA